MTLSAALDSGLAFGVVVVFFLFLYPEWSWLAGLQGWWGSRVFKEVSICFVSVVSLREGSLVDLTQYRDAIGRDALIRR